MSNYELRELNPNDQESYLELMFEFSNYKKNITQQEFANYLEDKNIKIIVLLVDNKIVGAGSLFILNKLHNNPVAQIEDVIITEKYRKFGFGKIIIDYLVNLGLNEFKCYKVILHCLEKNVGFYEKCGFKNNGFEMRY